MPLSRPVARFNKRYTNRLFKLIAARAPGFAIVVVGKVADHQAQ